MEILKSVLMLFAGLGVFLIGLKLMGDNLESLAGNKLRVMFNKISNNKFAGVATGAGVTALIQSSSATTVMVVGFVNAGVMSLNQAAAIIMGANIGTTITAQIVALQALPITAFFAALAGVGAFMQMSKKDKINNLGTILAGIGILFVGLYVMSNSMKSISELETVRVFLQKTTNPIILLLFGTALTALVQSSAATTSILIGLVSVNLMTLKSAIFVTLGINIGTCVTALLASIGATTNAKRASAIHLMFNIFGTVIFGILAAVLPIDIWLQKMFPGIPTTQVAMFHTFFNVLSTLIMLPLINQLTKLATLIVREKKVNNNENPLEFKNAFAYLDDRLISTPSIAMLMMRKEILLMGNQAKTNFELALDTILNLDLSKKDIFAAREKHLDFLNKELAKYLVKIAHEEISFEDEQEIASYYHVISDLERIGDYSENIIEYTEDLINSNSVFSDTAKEQIVTMEKAVQNLFDHVLKAFESRDLSEKAEVLGYEDLVDTYFTDLSNEHISRLNNNQCKVESASAYISLISHMERIGDHIMNVYNSMGSYLKAPTVVNASIKPNKTDVESTTKTINK